MPVPASTPPPTSRSAPTPWDEDAARLACERIVAEALAALDPVTLWPRHPRDVEPEDEHRTRGSTSLYLGAAAWRGRCSG